MIWICERSDSLCFSVYALKKKWALNSFFFKKKTLTALHHDLPWSWAMHHDRVSIILSISVLMLGIFICYSLTSWSLNIWEQTSYLNKLCCKEIYHQSFANLGHKCLFLACCWYCVHSIELGFYFKQPS